MNSIDMWNSFVESHNKTHPVDAAQLNAPATQSDFVAFKNQTNLDFPSSLKPIYEVNNGQKDGTGLFSGLEFLSINEIVRQWQSWNDTYQEELDGTLENMSESCTSFPPQAIKIAYSNPKWIPFSYDYSGNHIGIDLDPDVAGKVGQVINFGTDEEDKVVIAENFEDDLQRCLAV